MNIKFLITSAIIAALYVALTLLVAPFAYGIIQFRVSEMLNQLVVNNKKYIVGITLGCAIANLYSGNGLLDVVVGTGATLLGLSISILSFKLVSNMQQKYMLNTLIFSTVGMLPIALMLYYIHVIEEGTFLISFVYLIVSEAIIMTIGAFIMPLINSRFNLFKAIED